MLVLTSCTTSDDTPTAAAESGPAASPAPDGPYRPVANLCQAIDASPLKTTNPPLAGTGKHVESDGPGQASRSCTLPLTGGRLDVVAVTYDRISDATTAFNSAAASTMWKYRLTRSGPVTGVGQNAFARFGAYDATSVVAELTSHNANVVLTVNAMVNLPDTRYPSRGQAGSGHPRNQPHDTNLARRLTLVVS
ncbi:hypothetical protein [Phytohabitans rumicis]|uniref:Uncharacterized protein n=1 Tax=Phytohabitans rumicis TaxID=1076125 RepID=A0A6V8KY39_9ACTN|nr:hypothetical protein [Phytohabitans rumicis]GFJ87608.1 hypothetical protein Prum_012500 [Phytohabitans rumicis]